MLTTCLKPMYTARQASFSESAAGGMLFIPPFPSSAHCTSLVFCRQVGKNLKVPEDAIVVDATGKLVIPGTGHANGVTNVVLSPLLMTCKQQLS